MLAISGVYAQDWNTAIVTTEIMAKAMCHRGASIAVAQSGPVALAQNSGSSHVVVARLESSPAGDPHLIAFDGRLYFRNELELKLGIDARRSGLISDAELVLRAYRRWGVGMLERMTGTWALALWDGAERRLLLARDRLGVKPLYYYYRPGADLLFASELKALLRVPSWPRRPDMGSLRQYLILQSTVGPRTWLEDVQEVEPGTHVSYDGRTLVGHHYWSLPTVPAQTQRLDPFSQADQLREQLALVVCEQVADLETVGCYVSGGLDTGLLLALTTSIGLPRVEAVTATFEDPAVDERMWARQVVAHCAVLGHELEIDGRQHLKGLRALVRTIDQPVMGPPSYSAFLMARFARERGIAVMLSGDGGDDLLGATAEGALFQGQWPAVNPALLTPEFEEATAAAVEPCEQYRAQVANATDGWELNSIRLQSAHRQRLIALNDQLHSALGIESRVPFTDHHLWEWACTLSPEARSCEGYNKYVERLAAESLLPSAVVWRRSKGGFENPIDNWYRERQNRCALEELLFLGGLPRRRIVRADALTNLWEQHQNGASHGEALWLLLTMELWFQEILDSHR